MDLYVSVLCDHVKSEQMKKGHPALPYTDERNRMKNVKPNHTKGQNSISKYWLHEDTVEWYGFLVYVGCPFVVEAHPIDPKLPTRLPMV